MTGAAASPPSVLVLPGYGDSGPLHWQSLWEAADPRLRRVQQRDWLEPRLDDWLAALDREIAACTAAPVLVAHSLGCALVAHWVKRNGGLAARGALLWRLPTSRRSRPCSTPCRASCRSRWCGCRSPASW
jgi:predicted alpha/beta hydrolase family esterase